jgi:hypothetical protein
MFVVVVVIDVFWLRSDLDDLYKKLFIIREPYAL